VQEGIVRRKHLATLVCSVAAVLLLAASALGDDGMAAFAKRRDTMKEMGRALYLGVGRVAKGRTEFTPDTVAAAETVARLAATIGTLFPPGYDVAGSNMKPEILAASDQVAQLVAAVQAATPGFVAEVKSGDRPRIAAAYSSMTKACDACHNDFRKEE
jgi:cytochrome c556